MNWFVAGMLAAYVSACEFRAVAPHQACENRWNLALGMLVQSPAHGAISAAGRALGLSRRRYSDAIPDEEPRGDGGRG